MAYTPTTPPLDPKDLVEYLYKELLQLSAELNRVEEGSYLRIWQVPPPKPREGMLVIAAGAPGWNPGAGKGAYEYKSGSWAKL